MGDTVKIAGVDTHYTIMPLTMAALINLADNADEGLKPIASLLSTDLRILSAIVRFPDGCKPLEWWMEQETAVYKHFVPYVRDILKEEVEKPSPLSDANTK